ncbi:MAG: AmmeMemoRadiSam system radical SAM enzyme [bacterium]|nr:AmmeMemoRadiSam system radical SAM enzyme [bacterium]
MKLAKLYKPIKDKTVQCQACRWYCAIPQNQYGVCGVRKNIKGKLYLLVYGKAVGMHLDPIEKKPLFHFLPGTIALSFGTVGCSFGCLFCQNHFQSQPTRQIRYSPIPLKQKDKLIKQVINQQSQNFPPAKIVDLALKTKARSIAYTYNEPTIFIEYAYDTAKLAKKHGLYNLFVSNGFESKESLELITPYLDAINIDLKSFNPNFYKKIVKGRLDYVLDNIKHMHKKGIHLEITTLIIPNHNDSPEELTQIAQFIKSIDPDIPWHITAFYPAYKMLDTPPTPPETLLTAWQIGKKIGLNYVYIGNILDPQHSSTYCPKCNSLLIYRSGWDTQIIDLDPTTGTCHHCHHPIKGIWQ